MKRSDQARHQVAVRSLLTMAGIPIAGDAEIEVADFGLGRFEQVGLGLIVRINEPEYCSKWLTLFAGQACPRHYHKLKKETFFIHSRVVDLEIGGRAVTLQPGENLTIKPGQWHAFSSKAGAVVEEVSTHDENADSYFEDPSIVRDPIVEDD